MIKLSKRLQRIADFVPPASKLADIGSDHALLPVYLVSEGKCISAIAGELNAGPYESASMQVMKNQLQSTVSVRRGDGLSVIRPGEADTVTIAGMGGGLIVDILQAGEVQLADIHTLILQPNVAEDHVRKWLDDHGWVLIDEDLVVDDEITYTILLAQRGSEAHAGYRDIYLPRKLACGLSVDKELLLKFGPYLLERMDEDFSIKWHGELRKLERIIEHLRIAADIGNPETNSKLQQFTQEAALMKEVLQCMQRGKPSSR